MLPGCFARAFQLLPDAVIALSVSDSSVGFSDPTQWIGFGDRIQVSDSEIGFSDRIQ